MREGCATGRQGQARLFHCVLVGKRVGILSGWEKRAALLVGIEVDEGCTADWERWTDS